MNSVFSVSLQRFTSQDIVTLINCFVSMIIGIINSLELYLQIQNTMEDEGKKSVDFLILHMEICKLLSLHPENRNVDAKIFTEEMFNRYKNLIQNSKLINKIKNSLKPLNENSTHVGSEITLELGLATPTTHASA